jgi:hypothetical protein
MKDLDVVPPMRYIEAGAPLAWATATDACLGLVWCPEGSFSGRPT